MHYYKRNLGDYAKKAGRLSILQHGIYNLLIDACYDREQFPTTDEAIDWVWASSQEEIDGVKFVLRKFFEEQEDGKWVQNRIKEEIEDYRLKADKNKQVAIDRETKRKEKDTNRAKNNTNRTPNVNEPPPNQEPITNNHNKKPLSKPSAMDYDTEPDFIHFWKIYPRKEGKAKAFELWQKKQPKVDEVIKTLNWQIKSESWTKDNGQFVPLPATYINGERWQDEMPINGKPKQQVWG